MATEELPGLPIFWTDPDFDIAADLTTLKRGVGWRPRPAHYGPPRRVWVFIDDALLTDVVYNNVQIKGLLSDRMRDEWLMRCSVSGLLGCDWIPLDMAGRVMVVVEGGGYVVAVRGPRVQ